MAALSHFFLFLVAVSVAAAQQQQLNISLTSSLRPTSNSSWTSPSGLYAFGFYKKADPREDGYAVGIFLAGIREKTVVWTAVRDNPPFPENATLLFDSDSKLVLRSGQDQDIYIANPTDTPTSASMLDSGNFVLYNSVRRVIWQSFDFPTDTLLPGQRLLASTGQQLFPGVSETDKSTGIFRLQMQTDGNLVQYPVVDPVTSWHAYWSSETFTYGNNVTLNFDQDGRLYLLNATINIRNITDGGYPTKDRVHLIRVDPDGIFRLYKHNLTDDAASWSILWNSTNDKCAPKGLCGMNAFCFTNDQDAKCQCLPGFAPVSVGNQTSGCERNFTSESCKNNGPGSSVDYSMQEVTSTIWEDTYFSSLSSLTKDECKEACLEDCNCEAVLYTNGVCRKQRLPLRFGARSLGNSNTALIKVGSSTTGATGEPGNETKEGEKEPPSEILVAGIVFISIGFIALALSGFLVYRNHVWSYKRVLDDRNIGLAEDVSIKSYTYAELEKVTNNFGEEVGRGAFGAVYKGRVQLNGTTVVVAVKRLHKVLTEGDREFQNEIKAIGRTHHRNLVRLLGYCLEGSNRLLVYEYMNNGSLADVLFTPAKQPYWEERMEIARNIARGILYLHEECETQIIHCDIKPQNILMDEYGRPKISDFGLAKLLKPDQTRTYTGIRGTKGYVAPEWHRKQPVTVKADVYSFGIVLLEIISCRKSVDCSLTEDEAVLEEWVYQCFDGGQLGRLVGDEEVDKRQLDRVTKVGLWCILDDPSIRPSMKKVLLMLEGTVDIPVPPDPTSYFTTA